MKYELKITNASPESCIHAAVALIVEFDKFKSKIAVIDEYCTNENCNCRDPKLKFYEVDRNIQGDKLFEIKINVDSWEISEHKSYNTEINSLELIREFQEDLNDDAKLKLKKRFEFGKKFGGEVLKEDIDYSVISEGGCIVYGEIFDSKEYDESIFKYKGNQYFVTDQYCSNDKCECNDVGLSYYRLEILSDKYGYLFTIRADLFNEKYDVENKMDIADNEIKEIHEHFIKNLKNPEILRERYKRMKKILGYLGINKSSKEKSDGILPQMIIRQKIGRNDSCSCGSGKKYKKCCGRV